uniref:Chloride channel CLIC-like protein 1 n=1 Tax=Echeneis naucrates TaxID=173247 RepID=A0A665WIE7_ECHNA
MLLPFLVFCLHLAALGQQVEDWVDPYDMLNYDSTSKTMKKSVQPANYDNVATKRKEYTSKKVCLFVFLYIFIQIDEQKKKITQISQQPTCNPVFKRFLNRLLMEIKRLGLPSDSTDVIYDAKIKLSRQSTAEIQTFLDGEDSWRTGALDNAISQILVDLKAHDYEAWKWRFEDTFGVDVDTVWKTAMFVMVIMAIICTQLWSCVSWLIQFKRLFSVCFIVSIAWNWFYLYKIQFAEHQRSLAGANSVYEKCSGMHKMDWRDSLREFFRSTFTLQDDPCKKYYEDIVVNPILLVPPTKAISLTITTFITEPLKHIGQGISEFLRALLKDLPVTLQIPVLLIVMLAIMVVLYTSVNAAFRYGITAPLRYRQRDPRPPQLEPQQHQLQMINDRDHLAGGDAFQEIPRHRANDGRLNRNQVRQRLQNRQRERRVETLLAAEPAYVEDDTDSRQEEGESDIERIPSSDSDSEIQQGAQGEPAEVRASSDAPDATRAKPKPTQPDSSQVRAKPPKVNKTRDRDGPSRNNAALKAQPAGGQPPQTDAPVSGGLINLEISDLIYITLLLDSD